MKFINIFKNGVYVIERCSFLKAIEHKLIFIEIIWIDTIWDFYTHDSITNFMSTGDDV